MLWIAVSIACVALVVLLFVRTPARSALGLSFAAQHACDRRDWAAAARYCREAMAAAAKLKEPVKSQIETQIAAQWAAVLAAKNNTDESVFHTSSLNRA